MNNASWLEAAMLLVLVAVTRAAQWKTLWGDCSVTDGDGTRALEARRPQDAGNATASRLFGACIAK